MQIIGDNQAYLLPEYNTDTTQYQHVEKKTTRSNFRGKIAEPSIDLTRTINTK